MKSIIKASFVVFFACFSLITGAQTFELAKSNSAVISGTSSLHDWEMDVISAKSGFTLVTEGNNVKNIQNIKFSCNARDLKSESSIMDRKAWEALKSKEYPQITFDGSSISDLSSSGGNFTGKLRGKLTMAGQTREITVPFKGRFIDNRTVNIESSAELAFSTFNLEPPTAMLGTLKTGDKVTVTLNLQYVQK